MWKRVILLMMVLPVIFFLGCTEISELTEDLTNQSSTESPKILRTVSLAPDWKMAQMEIQVRAGEEVSILLKLADGNKLDGYFYLEKGDDIDFSITGNSLVYMSQAQDATAEGKISSDRFSFVANQAQGTTYTLTFSSTASGDETQTKVTVFLEIIYPETGSLFGPIDTG